MAALLSPKVLPILMLVASNVFMTFAWYGHLKFKAAPLYVVVVASWGIAFFEYWLAVPANRYTAARGAKAARTGHGTPRHDFKKFRTSEKKRPQASWPSIRI